MRATCRRPLWWLKIIQVVKNLLHVVPAQVQSSNVLVGQEVIESEKDKDEWMQFPAANSESEGAASVQVFPLGRPVKVMKSCSVNQSNVCIRSISQEQGIMIQKAFRISWLKLRKVSGSVFRELLAEYLQPVSLSIQPDGNSLSQSRVPRYPFKCSGGAPLHAPQPTRIL